MAPSLFNVLRFLIILFLLSFFNQLQFSTSFSPLCHSDERSALLQFKRSFVFNKSASRDPSAYPKVNSWNQRGETRECCLWDGVECDNHTGHVIGLDLSSSYLYGSIDSNSSLFQLVHLQRLSLADNNFSYSQIPLGFRHLSMLTHLNLSSSKFYGQIPQEILELTRLTSLDLTGDEDFRGEYLQLRNPDLKRLVEKLTSIQTLYLANVHISSEVPNSITNLSSLKSLNLENSRMFGLFPVEIFNLPNLQELNVLYNTNLTCYLPEFQQGSPLEILRLGYTNFSGELPTSIGNLHSLTRLEIVGHSNFYGPLPSSLGNLTNFNFYGPLPSSLGNLTNLRILDLSSNNFQGKIPSSLANLTNLRILDLSSNNFQGQIPSSLANLIRLTSVSLSDNNFSVGSLSWLGNQNKLTNLYLSGCCLTGEISSSLGNLTQLRTLSLSSNHLASQIPLWLGNLSHLTTLDLQENELHGPIPYSISKLLNLEILDLSFNNLSGNVNLDMFFNLKNLNQLYVSSNGFSSLIETNQNATIPNLMDLDFQQCNLREFPNFLRYQDNLVTLELSGNNIHGLIPNWLWNVSKETLTDLALGFNSLIGFEKPSNFLRCQDNLVTLELSGNNIHGLIPNWLWNVSRKTMEYLGLGFNSLTGFEEPLSLSSMSNLEILSIQSNKLQGPIPIPPPSIIDYFVTNNSLTGEIPPMLCNLPYLSSLNLSHNNLSGIIPQCLFNLKNVLSILDLSHNSLHGTIPETFEISSGLKMIDLSYNKLQGKMPKSLANQTRLEILNLQDNKIVDQFPYWLGALPNLMVLILRSNKFFGEIDRPTATSFNFSMLRIIDLSYNGFTGALPSKYFQSWNSMKGFDKDQFSYMTTYVTVQKRNSTWGQDYYYRFDMINKGVDREYVKIPKKFVVVDLSCNKFKGNIPKSIATLKKLKSLNLSNNHLSGHIPSQIVNLTELESLDLSSNMLTGVIPQQLEQLTFLSLFNVSHNRLMGPIPHGNQFDTYENISYMDNLGLCGKPLSNMCGNTLSTSTVKDDQESDSSTYIEWKAIVVGYWIGLVVVLVVTHSVWIMKIFG